MGSEHCLICGKSITEGIQVCASCMNKYGINATEAVDVAEQLRDIAGVLKITEGTDANIKKSMESLLNIADRLERKNNAENRRRNEKV